jgi:hypothetical protein
LRSSEARREAKARLGKRFLIPVPFQIDLMMYGTDVMDSAVAAFDAECGLLKLGVDS